MQQTDFLDPLSLNHPLLVQAISFALDSSMAVPVAAWSRKFVEEAVLAELGSMSSSSTTPSCSVSSSSSSSSSQAHDDAAAATSPADCMLALYPAVLDLVERWQQHGGAATVADSAGTLHAHGSRSRHNKAAKQSRQLGPDTTTTTSGSSEELQELAALAEELQFDQLLSEHYQQVRVTNTGKGQQQWGPVALALST